MIPQLATEQVVEAAQDNHVHRADQGTGIGALSK